MKKPTLFISYSSKDKEKALYLAKELEKRGIDTWIDQWGIKVGDNFSEKIYQGIQNCDYFAILLTKNSVNSRWVKEELSMARIKELDSEGVKVLPLKYEDCDIPDNLKTKQYADFSNFENGLLEILEFFGLADKKASILGFSENLKDVSTHIYHPTLMIGLGGSGIQIISHIKRSIPTPLREILPLRFLGFDITTSIRSMAGLDESEFISGAMTRDEIASELARVQSTSSWFGGKIETGVPLLDGAGNDRRLGRLSFLFNSHRFYSKINEIALSLIPKENEFSFVAIPEIVRDKQLYIMIYASLAGGTGSGALIDVAYLSKTGVKDISHKVIGFPIIPTSFDRKENRYAGSAQSFAALRELDRFMKAPQAPNTTKWSKLGVNLTNFSSEKPFDDLYMIDFSSTPAYAAGKESKIPLDLLLDYSLRLSLRQKVELHGDQLLQTNKYAYLEQMSDKYLVHDIGNDAFRMLNLANRLRENEK